MPEVLTRLLYVPALAVLSVWAVASFMHLDSAWGISIAGFLPPAARLGVAIILGGLVGIAFLGSNIGDVAEQAGTTLFSIWGRIVVPVVCAFVFWVLPAPVPLLGDSTMYAGTLWRYVLLGEQAPMFREPASMIILQAIAQAAHALGATDMTVIFKAFGALSAGVFMGGAMALAAHIHVSSARRLLTVTLMLTCAGSLFFTGYMETYALQYACLPWVIWASFKLTDDIRNLTWTLLALGALCSLHYMNVLFLPAVLTAYAITYTTRRGTVSALSRRMLWVIAVSLPILVAVYVYLQLHPPAAMETGDNPFIPFSAVHGTRYTLFSAQHVLDIVNQHMLLAPVPLFLAIALVAQRGRRMVRGSRMMIVGVALLAMESFLIGGHFTLGMARDWDVTASIGTLITIGCALLLEETPWSPKHEGRAWAISAAVALTGCFVWISVNVSESPAIARYETLLAGYRSTISPVATRFGYENLRKLYYGKKAWLDELRIDRTMLAVLPWHFDLRRALGVVEEHQGELGAKGNGMLLATVDTLVQSQSDSVLLADLGGDERSIRIAPLHAGDPCTLADLITEAYYQEATTYKYLTYQAAVARADSVIRRHPRMPHGYQLRGELAARAGDYANAERDIRTAIRMDPSRASAAVSLASLFNACGKRDSVRAYAARGLDLDPAYYQGLVMMAIGLDTTLTSNDTTDIARVVRGAALCLSQGEERNLTSDERAMLDRLSRAALGADRLIRSSRTPGNLKHQR